MSSDQTIKVLHIEDDDLVAVLYENMLKSCKHMNFDIERREGLQSGISYLNSVNYDIDIILLDLMLPNSVGVETFKEVYNVCPSIPVVIISSDEEKARQCISLGAQDYLVKSDITPQLLARAVMYAIERTKNERIIEESERRYKELIEATGAAIYEIDIITRKFIYVNEGMTKLTGWSKEELLKMGPEDFVIGEALEVLRRRLIGLKGDKHTPATHEYKIRVRDGSTKWVVVTGTYRQYDEGQIVGEHVVLIDITEWKEAEEEEKKKEGFIFRQLESRIVQWRDEIAKESVSQQNKIKDVSREIESIANGAEALL
jgi:PAS domain S-box-containing protein